MLINVLVHGENFYMRFSDEKQYVGFYVTVTVEAGDFEEAEELAITTLRGHENLKGRVMNRVWQPKPMMYVEEMSYSTETVASNTGFAWYVIGKNPAQKFGPN